MVTKLTTLTCNIHSVLIQPKYELRIDINNDTHFAIEIDKEATKAEIVYKLEKLARNIRNS